MYICFLEKKVGKMIVFIFVMYKLIWMKEIKLLCIILLYIC